MVKTLYLGFTLLALWTAELVVKVTISHLRGRIKRGQPAIWGGAQLALKHALLIQINAAKGRAAIVAFVIWRNG